MEMQPWILALDTRLVLAAVQITADDEDYGHLHGHCLCDSPACRGLILGV